MVGTRFNRVSTMARAFSELESPGHLKCPLEEWWEITYNRVAACYLSKRGQENNVKQVGSDKRLDILHDALVKAQKVEAKW
jgi:hypothetical protein